MAVENPKSALTPTEAQTDRGLVLSLGTQLLTLLSHSGVFSANKESDGHALALRAASIIIENPAVVNELLRAVYLQPDLLPKMHTEESKRLADINTRYHDTVAYFTDERVQTLLSSDEHRPFRNRIDEFRQHLAAADTLTPIHNIELVLYLLIDDGDRNKAVETGLNPIQTSHQVFGAIRVQMDADRVSTHPLEDRALNALGQNLLGNLRLLTAKTPSFSAYHQQTPKRERDYAGRLAQSRLTAKFIAILGDSDDPRARDMIADIQKNIPHNDDYLRTHFPDRYPGLHKDLGLKGGEDWRRWAEHPGEPKFTPAEAQDFLNAQ